MKPEDIIRMPRGVRVHEDKLRKTMVLLAPERAIMLDPIGLAILGAIDGKKSFATLTGELAAQYDAPVEQIAGDCAEFITSLLERRILERA